MAGRSDDDILMSSGDEGRSRANRDSPPTGPRATPTIGSPSPQTMLDRLLSEGYALEDIRALLAEYDRIPRPFRGSLLLRTRDLVLPLDVCHETLRRDLEGCERSAEPIRPTSLVGHERPAAPIHSSEVPPSCQVDVAPVVASTSGATLPGLPEAPSPGSSILKVTFSEAAGRVSTVTPATKRPLDAPSNPASQAPKLACAAGACGICHVPLKSTSLRYHMLSEHLPWFFFGTTACFTCRVAFSTNTALLRHMARHHDGEEVNVEQDYLVWLHGMMDLLGVLTGLLGFVAPHMLVTLCSQRGISASGGSHFQHAMVPKYRDLALVMGDPLKGPLRSSPPNHPVAVLHWEVIYGLLCSAPGLDDKGKLRDIPVVSPPPNLLAAEPRWATGGDGHCHLRLAVAKSGLDLDQAVKSWSAGTQGFRMDFLIDNHVFEGDWTGPFPVDLDLSGEVTSHSMGVYHTFGLHPRLAGTDPVPLTLAKLRDLASGPRCVGVGEFGLDKSCPRTAWGPQSRMFRKHATLGVSLNKVLVLHLRGSTTITIGEVLDEAVTLLKDEGVPTRHPIHVHCFTGSLAESQAWLKVFPNTKFGTSSKSLEPGQGLDFVRRTGMDFLILESDAPYLGPRPAPTSPWCIYQLAKLVGRVRNLPARVVLSLSASNAKALYGIP